MKAFEFVIVNFFTEKKKFIMLNLEDLEEVEKEVDRIGESNPDCVIAAYLKGELINAHRPHNVIKDKSKVQEGEMGILEFITKWKLTLGGEQDFPDYSLPKRRIKRIQKIQKVEEINPTRGRKQKPHQAKFREIVPQAAGV